MNYLQLLWAGMMGWLVFDHLPDHTSLVGMVLITVRRYCLRFQSPTPSKVEIPHKTRFERQARIQSQ